MPRFCNQLLFVALIPLAAPSATFPASSFGLQIHHADNEAPGPKGNCKNRIEQPGNGAGMTPPGPISSGTRVTRFHSVV